MGHWPHSCDIREPCLAAALARSPYCSHCHGTSTAAQKKLLATSEGALGYEAEGRCEDFIKRDLGKLAPMESRER